LGIRKSKEKAKIKAFTTETQRHREKQAKGNHRDEGDKSRILGLGICRGGPRCPPMFVDYLNC